MSNERTNCVFAALPAAGARRSRSGAGASVAPPAGSTPVTDLWRAAGPALMLVPSMGGDSTNNAHQVRAKQLAQQHGTATVVASQHPEERRALGLGWQPGSDRQEGSPSHTIEVYWTVTEE